MVPTRRQLSALSVLAATLGLVFVIATLVAQPLRDRWRGRIDVAVWRPCEAIVSDPGAVDPGLATVHRFERQIDLDDWKRAAAGSVYVPLRPAPGGAHASGEQAAGQLFWRAPPGMEDREIARQLSAGEAQGRLRRPQLRLLPGLYNEDHLFAESIPSAARWVIASQEYGLPGGSWPYVVLAALAACCGWGTFANSIIQRPARAWWGCGLLAICLAGGLCVLIPNAVGSAVWNTLSQGAALAVSFSAVMGMAVLACRGATLATRCQPEPTAVPQAAPSPASELPPLRQPFSATETGFRILDDLGERIFQDVDVVGLSIACDEGPTSTRRRVVRLRLSAAHQHEVFRLSDTLAADQPDPLGGFLSRLIGGLIRRGGAELLSGGSLSGDGWTLNRIGLELPQAGRVELVSLSMIAAAEWIGGEYCLWTQDNHRAILRLPAESENVLVLAGLLPDLRIARSGGAPTTHPFGRLLVELHESRSGLQRLLGKRSASGWQLHERGLVVADGNEVAVPLEEISSLRVERLDDGIALRCTAAGSAEPLSLCVAPSQAKAVDVLEQRLAEPIANRLLQELVLSLEAGWTETLRVRMTGLVLRQAGTDEEIPFDQLGPITVAAQEIHIACNGRPPISLTRAETNAAAGLILLRKVHEAVADVQQSRSCDGSDALVRPAGVSPESAAGLQTITVG